MRFQGSERKSVQIAESKFSPFAIHCRAIVAMVVILTFFARGQRTQAADGDLDPTFGTASLPTPSSVGRVMTDFDHSTDIANAVAVHAQRQLILVAATYQTNQN